MTLKNAFIAVILVTIGAVSCTNSKKTESENSPTTMTNPKEKNSYVSLLEIPATDLSRAVNFYQSILDLKIEIVEMPEMKMGILPYENQVVTAVLVQADGYIPSADGVTIYLNGGDNLQVILDKVEKNGGKILTPKTQHADESGFFALFLDSEGNKIGLNSVH